MNMKWMDCNRRLRVLWLALLTVALPAPADDFEVEVIVFRHAAQAAGGAWAATDSVPNLVGARRLAEPEASAAPEAETVPFTRLPPTAHRLEGAARLLAGSAAYELIAHEAWRQPGESAVPVLVAETVNASAPPAVVPAPESALLPATPARPRAEGTVLLQVAAPDMRVATDFVVLAGDTPLRVRASRNLRSGELHYLDHEVLGILLQVTSLAPPAAAPAAGETQSPNADVPPGEFSD
jgi:hypothetical protein